MRIRIDFTIDVPEEHVTALIALSATESGRKGAAEFVRAEAEENLFTYLEENGVPAESVRGIARRGGAR